MPTIETIKASEAPLSPKKMSKASAKILAALSALKKDEVLCPTPDEGKSLPGLKTSVGRIASGNSVKIQSWRDAAGEVLYVRKV